ncbi:hypothetical protein QJS10_CPA03g01371 [Acorus calamus]|uniref:Uncharacterized protein n=1 Tax=Acorus calamus TaxID=4465 RepID=A0AAV9FA64_ACOCL|nr:hypothetical protein QJS10_CPA03g01371 [Acorus calamus]
MLACLITLSVSRHPRVQLMPLGLVPALTWILAAVVEVMPTTTVERDITFSSSKTFARHKNREEMNTYAESGKQLEELIASKPIIAISRAKGKVFEVPIGELNIASIVAMLVIVEAVERERMRGEREKYRWLVMSLGIVTWLLFVDLNVRDNTPDSDAIGLVHRVLAFVNAAVFIACVSVYCFLL